MVAAVTELAALYQMVRDPNSSKGDVRLSAAIAHGHSNNAKRVVNVVGEIVVGPARTLAPAHDANLLGERDAEDRTTHSRQWEFPVIRFHFAFRN